MAKYFKCVADTQITGAPALEYSERFGVGAIVDLDRVVGSTMEPQKDARGNDAPPKRRDWKLGELVNMNHFIETDDVAPPAPPVVLPRDAEEDDEGDS